MTEFAYPYHDVDIGGHKRQRIGEPGQNLWVPNERLTTESQSAYDPVRDTQGDTNFTDQTFFNFETNQMNDWFSENPQLLPPSIAFDNNSLLMSQPFDHQITAPFDANFQETQIYDQESASDNAIEADGNELADVMEDEPSPEPAPGVICFGMVADIPAHCNQSGSLLVDSASQDLTFIQPNSLRYSENGKEGEFGKLEDRTAKIFANLLAQEGMAIQIYSRNTGRRPGLKPKGGKKAKKKTSQSLVNAIIYGPEELCEEVGKYLTKCGIFLQDPLQNDRDVIYKNPHILSRDEEVVLISELTIDTSDAQSKGFDSSGDLFSQLSKDDHLSLTEAPDVISTELYPHQKKALTFMMQREQPWTFEGSEGDLWVKEADETGGIIYTNLITSSSQSTPPPESRGGLLADKMGLGKSLTMISLIALNPLNLEQCNEPVIFTSTGTIRRVKSTLIVVSFSLLTTWDTQLTRHLKPKTLTWTRFHGPQKAKILSFSASDIVITTYETLVSQQKKARDPSNNADTLFSFFWHRVVLDEAHTIRNRATSMASACGAVRATSRWAMTGTPIQNRESDFSSLLSYLGTYPFSNHKIFESLISKPFFRSDDPDPVPFRKIVNHISLCRTKAVISLPKRTNEIKNLELGKEEREYYDEIKNRTIRKMDEALAMRPVLGTKEYLNALQWLNELRLICNHGLVHKSRKNHDNDDAAQLDARTASQLDAMPFQSEELYRQPWTHKTASRAFETMVKAGQAVCVLCKENITEGTGEAANSELPKPRLSRCFALVCGSCAQITVDGKKVEACVCKSKCRAVDVSWAPESAGVGKEKERIVRELKPEEVSTKLKALLECLKGAPEGEKSVVFSYWTFTLDLIEILLREAGIKFTRIDGKLSGDQREKAIHEFDKDESVKAILVSITCGGTGLDLTAASVAYLLEPQWNPMIEEQALSRIHRMGQTKEVRTVRFTIKNSFEEKIAVIQQDKKDLAAWAFSDEDRAEAADGAARLQVLRGAFR